MIIFPPFFVPSPLAVFTLAAWTFGLRWQEGASRNSRVPGLAQTMHVVPAFALEGMAQPVLEWAVALHAGDDFGE